jgi:hypothetical protein
MIVEASMPVLADDGQSAILIDGRSWGPDAGEEIIFKLEHQPDGSWRAVKAMPVWAA